MNKIFISLLIPLVLVLFLGNQQRKKINSTTELKFAKVDLIPEEIKQSITESVRTGYNSALLDFSLR